MNGMELKELMDVTVAKAVKEFAEKQKNALKKFIWKHNIPECIFYDVTDELLKEYEK